MLVFLYIYIYQTYYVVCSDRHYSRFRMLALKRTVAKPQQLSDILTEDRTLYSWARMEAQLQALQAQAKADGTGKITRAFTAVALVGCIRFLKGYYFIFVTQRRKIGCIGGNFVYGIGATQQLSVSKAKHDDGHGGGSSSSSGAGHVATGVWAWMNRWLNPSPEEEAEARYLGLFHFIDLTNDFYFRYSYDMTHSLQYNMTADKSDPAEM